MSYCKSQREEMPEDLNLTHESLSDDNKRQWLLYKDWGAKDQGWLLDSMEVHCLSYMSGWDLV